MTDCYRPAGTPEFDDVSSMFADLRIDYVGADRP